MLRGSEDSRVPSALYSEKAYVMSRSFVKTALEAPPRGLDDILAWLYRSPGKEGPCLLDRVVHDAGVLITGTGIAHANNGSIEEIGAIPSMKLSAGAKILLQRILASLSNITA